jgi:hypothetical protein
LSIVPRRLRSHIASMRSMERRSEMHKFFNRLRTWLDAVTAVPDAPDPLSLMDPRELADLPVSHPLVERHGR